MDMEVYLDELDEDNPTIKEIMNHPSYSKILNGTANVEALEELLKSYLTNRRLDEPFHTFFLCTYSLLIMFGTIGNCLVVSAVIRKPSMRTARNIFIFNLAVSDLLLCVITMPLTLMEILTTYWPLGSSVFLCKLFGSLQATSIFVSTISITAIALDRYHVIVYPTKRSVQRVGVVIVLGGIWTLSCLLAAPLFIWRKLVHQTLDFAEIGLSSIDFCHEDWPTEHGRAYYSVFTIIFQYMVPVTIVSLAYLGICIKLRYRMKPGQSRACDSRSAAGADRDNSRVRRTNTLLISIALIFGISWMPLNVLNVIADLTDPFKDDQKTYFVIYGMCHLIGMSSACSNPVLYGWLNENFLKEFKDIWSSVKDCCCRVNTEVQVGRGSISRRADAEHMTVTFKKSRVSQVDEGDVEQSTLITQVLDRQK